MTHRPILIICDSLPGALTSTAPMVDSLRHEFEKMGHAVRIAGIGSEPHVRTQDLAVYAPRLKSSRLIERALAEFGASIWLGISLLCALVTRRLTPPSLVVLFVPSLFLCLPAWMVKLVSRARVYLVQRDIVPDWLVASQRLEPGIAVSVLYALKNFCLKHSDHVGIECEENFQFFPARFRSKISVLHNWRDFDRDIHSRLTSSEHVVFVYGGRVGQVQGFDRFLRPFAELQHPRALLRIYCDERGQAEIESMGLSVTARRNIEVLPMLPEAEFLVEASKATFGVVTLAPDMQTHNIPGKILAYLAAGIPVFAVAPRTAALARIVKQLGIGCCADADSHDEIRSMLLREIDNADLDASTRETVVQIRRSFSATLAAEAILAAVGDRTKALESRSAT